MRDLNESIDPSDVHAALCVALDLPDAAGAADLSAAVARLDAAGALRTLHVIAGLLEIAPGEGVEVQS